MTSGQSVWTLSSVDYPDYISAVGLVFSPPTRSDPLPSYVFMRLNFACTSGQSLIEEYTGQDMGLTFIHQQQGYPDVYIEDYQGHRTLVTLIGSCWLAAPIPQTLAEDTYFTLHFQSLPPFEINPLIASPAEMPKFAFATERDLNPEIYTMSPNGEEISRLTNHPDSDTQPAWSPDRQRLAFTTTRDNNSEIYLMDPNGENLFNLTNHPSEDRSPAWSPTGGSIAFETMRNGNWEIYAMQANGSNPRNLTNHPDADSNPSWSPDGLKIAFQSHREGDWEIYVLDLVSKELKRLTVNPGEDQAPAWSPDGSRIAFWSQRNGSWGLYLIEVESGQLQSMVQFVNPGSSPGRPAWSPDGLTLLFAIQFQNNLELYQIDATGANVRRLTNNDTDDYDPNW
jgi:TolB protein